MTLTPIQWAVVVGFALLALLVARGVYLIGSGADAEHKARATARRQQLQGNPILSSGFGVLDGLREGNYRLGALADRARDELERRYQDLKDWLT